MAHRARNGQFRSPPWWAQPDVVLRLQGMGYGFAIGVLCTLAAIVLLPA